MKLKRSVRLSLLAKSASHLAVFFSHNKSANSTFSHGLQPSEQVTQLSTDCSEMTVVSEKKLISESHLHS
jgi:hypothetical protein